LTSRYGCDAKPLPFAREEASAVWRWLIAHEMSVVQGPVLKMKCLTSFCSFL